MTTIATSLAKALPKPKYTGEHEQLPSHTQSKGPRILGAGALDELQIVLKVSSPIWRTKQPINTKNPLANWATSISGTSRMAPTNSRRLR